MKEHDFQILSMLGRNSSIKDGHLSAASDVNISGFLELNISGEQTVSVTETGTVIGNVTAANIIISGKVIGDIYAKNSFTLKSTAVISGSVYSPSLMIEEGASGNFDCSMSSTPAKKTARVVDQPPENKKSKEAYKIEDVPQNVQNGTSQGSGYW